MQYGSPSRAMPPPPSSGDLKTAWVDVCRHLKYDEALRAAGAELLDKLVNAKDGVSPQISDGAKMAAAAYLASSANKPLPGVSVTELATRVQLHMTDFFKSVEEVHSRLYPSSDASLSALKPLKSAFLMSSIQHRKWTQFARELFPNGFSGATEDDGGAGLRLSFELGWLLYALAKCFSTPETLGSPLPAYHLLAAVVHLLLAHIPEEARTSSVFWLKLEGPTMSTTEACYPFPADAQAVLSAHLKTVDDLMLRQQPTVVALLRELSDAGELSKEGSKAFRALLAPTKLAATVDAVRTRYEALWRAKVPLDDTYYLHEKPTPPRQPNASEPASPYRPAAHASAASLNGGGTPGGVGASPGGTSSNARHAGLLTPLRHSNPMGGRHHPPIPQTPMTSQLDAVGWLTKALPHDAANVIRDGPELGEFFDACAHSPRDDIAARLDRLLGLSRTALLDARLDEATADEQLEKSRGLYYKMLLAFLKAEQGRLGQTDFTPLLTNNSFHSSLLACCLESVYASYSTPCMAFPRVLEVLELQPFDFGKVIESFIKHEPHLPAHLKQHFAEAEAQIIESLAWGEASPLHGLMAEYDAAIKAANGQPAAGASRAKAALEQFVKKCLYLAAKRIQELCLRLLLESTLTQQIWDVAKQVLDDARDLLLGRHLDQVLLCAVYGVCKVNQRSVTFRQIIEQYKRQPGASPRTFREVRMSEGREPQDIIQFYNLVFIPRMKDHLLRVCGAAGAAAAASGGAGGAGGAGGDGTAFPASPSGINEARGTASPRHVSGRGGADVYVSRHLSASPRLTPRTRTLYAFSETPAACSDRLRHFNSTLTSAGDPTGAADALQALSSTPSGATDADGAGHRGRTTLGGDGGVASGLKRNRSSVMMDDRDGDDDDDDDDDWALGDDRLRALVERAEQGRAEEREASSKESEDGPKEAWRSFMAEDGWEDVEDTLEKDEEAEGGDAEEAFFT